MSVLLSRSPQYNSVRLGFTMIIALCFGAFYWAVSACSAADSALILRFECSIPTMYSLAC
jgi:hypothetical protein